MSSTETWFGSLRKIEFSPFNLTWGDKLRVLMDEGWKIDIDQCDENFYIEEGEPLWKNETRPFLKVLNGDIYEISNYTRTYDEEYHGMDVWDNGNNTIGFSGSFYNGGTDLIEMLERELRTFKPSKVLWSHTYCSEDLGHVGNDIDEIWDEVCVGIPDDGGIPLGRFKVTITFEGDDE